MYGFIGRNGSGKTMLFRILGGLVRPTSGKVILDGSRHDEDNQTNRIGLVIENASSYPNFTGLKNLTFLAKINNYIGQEDVRNAIEKVGLDAEDKRTISKYSLGMKQRFVLAQEIWKNPISYYLTNQPTH